MTNAQHTLREFDIICGSGELNGFPQGWHMTNVERVNVLVDSYGWDREEAWAEVEASND